jgi:hypothetical protein
VALLPSTEEKIQVEEVSYKSAVSEGTAKKLGSNINFILDQSSTYLGDIKISCLTESQFQAIRGDRWVLMSGQSIAGSDLATLTGITTLPNFTGLGAHLEQLTSIGSMFDFYPNQNLDHDHDNGAWSRILRVNTFYNTVSNQFLNRNTIGDIDASAGEPELTTSRELVEEGGDRFRPNSYQVNFFIKINN